MTMHLQKWGNSLGIRVPAQYVKQLNLNESDALEMIVDSEAELLIIRRKPTRYRKKYDMTSLLSQVESSQLSGEAWDEDTPRGHEAW